MPDVLLPCSWLLCLFRLSVFLQYTLNARKWFGRTSFRHLVRYVSLLIVTLELCLPLYVFLQQ